MLNYWKWRGLSLMTLLVLGLVYASSLSVAKGPKPKPPPAPTVSYDMELLPAPLTRVVGMNNFGDVVGDQFLYTAETGQVVDLRSLSGLPDGWINLNAVDINDLNLELQRQIVGNYVDLDGLHAYRGIIEYVEGGGLAFTEFTIFDGTEDFPLVYPYAINNNGDVVGLMEDDPPDPEVPDVPGHAFLWTEMGGTVDLVVGPDGSIARDINDAGEVAGDMTVSGERHAFRYTQAGGVEDLGGLRKRPRSWGNGINSQGQITGYCSGDYYYSRTFRFTVGEGMEDLGTLYKDRYSWSRGFAINSSGHVVGQSGESHDWTDPRQAGFLHTDETGMLDIATLVSNPPAGWDPMSIYPVAVGDPASGEDFGPIGGSVKINDINVPFLLRPAN
jgi:probable HAF family extracellular repeat protein